MLRCMRASVVFFATSISVAQYVVVVVVEVGAQHEVELRRVAADAAERRLQPLGEVAEAMRRIVSRSPPSLSLIQECQSARKIVQLTPASTKSFTFAHADEAGAEVDLAGDLEADVVPQRRAGRDEPLEVLAREHLVEVAGDGLDGVRCGHTAHASKRRPVADRRCARDG